MWVSHCSQQLFHCLENRVFLYKLLHGIIFFHIIIHTIFIHNEKHYFVLYPSPMAPSWHALVTPSRASIHSTTIPTNDRSASKVWALLVPIRSASLKTNLSLGIVFLVIHHTSTTPEVWYTLAVLHITWGGHSKNCTVAPIWSHVRSLRKKPFIHPWS